MRWVRLQAQRRSGCAYPEDVSVIGFDDVEYTTMFHPYVTTVVQPCFDIGHTAVDMVCKLIQRKEVRTEVILPQHLVIRESVSKNTGT